MSVIVTYDLCQGDKDYDSLNDYFDKYPNKAKVTESTWILQTDKKCVQIRDEIKKVIDSNDRVFVGKLMRGSAWRNPIDGSTKVQEAL